MTRLKNTRPILQRLKPCSDAALDGGGDQAFQVEAMTDQLKDPQFLWLASPSAATRSQAIA